MHLTLQTNIWKGSVTAIAADIDGDGVTDIVSSITTDGQKSNVFTVLRNMIHPPAITDFTPKSGVSGTTVTLKGVHFTGATGVLFSGVVPESSSLVNDSTIVATSKGGATGKISVSSPFGNATSPSDFTFFSPPFINSVLPNIGAPGTTVIIKGKNFIASKDSNIVHFGAALAIVLAATDTTLTVTVPVNATCDNISVATRYITGYSPLLFTPAFGGASKIKSNSFATGQEFTAPYPNDLTITDVDGDGKNDLVLTNDRREGLQTPNYSVYRNTSTIGSISLAAPVGTVFFNYNTTFVAPGDLSGDGKPDMLVIASSSISAGLNVSAPGNVKINPLSNHFDALGSVAREVAIRDIDGDGKPDVIAPITNQAGQSFRVFRNYSIPVFIQLSGFKTFSGSPSSCLIVGDIDGDGKADVVTASISEQKLYVARNTSVPSNFTFAAPIALAVPSALATGISLKLADLDGDGKLDIITANINSNSISVLINKSTPGNILFDAAVNFATTVPAPLHLALGDLDGDGKTDILVTYSQSNIISVFNNTSTPGNLSMAPDVLFSVSGATPGLTPAISDVDGDGKPDIVVADEPNSKFTILRNVIAYAPIATISGSTMLCQNSPAPKITFTGKNGQAPYTFTYNINGGASQTVSTVTGDTVTVLASTGTPGIFNYRLTGVVDNTSNSSTIIDSAVVTISAAVAINITATSGLISCGNDSIAVKATGGYGGFMYNINNSAYQAGSVFTGLGTGVDTIGVKDQKGCTATKTVTINLLGGVYNTTSTQVCYGATAYTYVNAKYGKAPYQYSINSGATYQPGNTFALTAGSYNVVIKDSLGCTYTTNALTITQPAAATAISDSVFGTSCTSNYVKIYGAGGYGGYTYSVGSGAYQPGNMFTGLVTSTTYALHVKDQQGCTVTKTITVQALTGTYAATATQVCYGATAYTYVNAKYGTAPYQFSLNGGAYQAANNFKVPAGSYKVTVKDTLGCTYTTNTVTITQPAVATAISDAVTAVSCTSNKVAIRGSDGYGGYTFSLNSGAYQADSIFTGLVTSTTYALHVKDQLGCTVTKTVTVQPLTATYAATGTQVCYGATAYTYVNAKYGTAPYQYSLNGGAYQAANNFKVPAGSYKITVKDMLGCTYTTTALIITQPASALSVSLSGVNASCKGGVNGSIAVTASGGYGNYTYSLNGQDAQEGGNFDGLAAGNYTVTVKDANACSASKNITISQPATPCFAGSVNTKMAPVNGLQAITIKAWPNPSQGEFMLTIAGGDKNSKAEIRVMDMLGRVLYQNNGSLGQTYRFGGNFISGVYLAEVITGKTVQTIKLVKAK